MVLLIDIDINTPKLPGYSKNVISTENRRYLKAATGITSDNLSRYIGKLRDKGLIIKGKADDGDFISGYNYFYLNYCHRTNSVRMSFCGIFVIRIFFLSLIYLLNLDFT
jgi:hypothetical protein